MLKVTCALIIENGKVLITQNDKSSDHAFQWEFPGGKINDGETKKECIVREISEELELDILVENNLIPVEHDYAIKKIKLIPFICSIKGGNLKLNNHINAKWVELTKLQKIDFSEADKRLIMKGENMELLKEYSRKQKD